MSQPNTISRRSFIGRSLASLPLAHGALALGAGRDDTLTAGVLEFADKWSGQATGARVMLEQAGFRTIDLTLDTPPMPGAMDLIFFGAFANHDDLYGDYTTRYATALRDFVAAGGVVVQMSQASRYGPRPLFLPESMDALYCSHADTHRAIVRVADHPAVTPWAGGTGTSLAYEPSLSVKKPRVRESIQSWRGLRLLIGDDTVTPPRAALLEGTHGRGRFLLSALWLDKLFDKAGAPAVDGETMSVAQRFFASLHTYVQDVRTGVAPAVAPTPIPASWAGPMLGHVDETTAMVWARASEAGSCSLVLESDGETVRRFEAIAEPSADLCLHWRIDNLRPDTAYRYHIEQQGKPALDGKAFAFRTAPPIDAARKTVIAFGSCVSSTDFAPLWQRIEETGAEAMVLLGDTPYIDSTDLDVNRLKHRELLLYPPVAKTVRTMPTWATWDDHDFGKNDSDGLVDHRADVHRAFKEHRALASYGEAGEGIYTRFRRGPLDVFLLDTRFFSQTGPSFADPSQPTLLGERQWNWLKNGLKSSDAPFKLLACGFIWDDKQNKEKDDWATYHYERQALLDFVAAERIAGVMMMGGDIHVSRLLKYKTEATIGYPLYQFITSPMHERVIPSLNVDHPDLVFGVPEPNTFLTLTLDTTAEPYALTAEWINIKGDRFHRLHVTQAELTPRVSAAAEAVRAG